jgi:hypothetical protein
MHMNLGEGYLLLQRSSIQGALLLSDFDNPEELSHVDLRFASAGTVDPHPNSWPKSDRLFLDGFRYSAFGSLIAAKNSINWLRLSNRAPLMLQPYEQAARVLLQSGYESEANQTLIAKFEDLLRYGDLTWLQRLWNRCVGVTVGYGYRSHRALLVMLGIIVVGTVFFQAARKNHLMLETNISWASDVKKANYPKFQPLLYSMDTFLPIVNLGQKDYWAPNVNSGVAQIPVSRSLILKFTWGSALRAYLIVHIIFGWIFTTLWVAGLTGLVRKQN